MRRAVLLGHLVFTLLLSAARAHGAGPYQGRSVEEALQEAVAIAASDTLLGEEPPSRALTAALAIALGPFGGHRILLGTSPVIPVVYGITFGGFGLLVLIDLGHILFTHDLRGYMNDRHVLMWAGRGAERSATPR